MAQSDVYKKFLIEYDKAEITSSFPSLTKTEVAILLDKAYLALIGEKVTGNNQRGAQFESDIKAMEDIRPLLVTTNPPLQGTNNNPSNITNAFVCKLPTDMLYYVSATIRLYNVNAVAGRDLDRTRILPVSLISHTQAQRFFASAVNMPWIKNPVAFTEGGNIIVLYDKYETARRYGEPNSLSITYIKQPQKFDKTFPDNKYVEVNDTMVEELINLAIVMAGEIVESPRTQTKAQLRQLEA